MEKKYKVFYQGSLYGHFGRDRAGKEIEINKSFLWGGESWLVPSVYVCGKGLVADIFKKVSIESFREFIENSDSMKTAIVTAFQTNSRLK